MILAVEDRLTEILARKLLSSVRPDLVVSSVVGHRGNTYLRQKADRLNQTAVAYPVFLLTDLDLPNLCPADLISSWLSGPRNMQLLFRVIKLEAESWILADRKAFAEFLSIPLNTIPTDVESIIRPKEFLIALARKSRKKEIKKDIVPRSGGTARVGPAYNPCLSSFVSERWDLNRASISSDSLRRAIERLKEFLLT